MQIYSRIKNHILSGAATWHNLNCVATYFWTFFIFFLAYSLLLTTSAPPTIHLLILSPFLYLPNCSLPLLCSPLSPRCKNTWINKIAFLLPSFPHNDDPLFSKFHYIHSCRVFIPPDCQEHCTPPRGQTHSPAVEVIKRHPNTRTLQWDLLHPPSHYSLPNTQKYFCGNI